jgi:hypothetical protein
VNCLLLILRSVEFVSDERGWRIGIGMRTGHGGRPV